MAASTCGDTVFQLLGKCYEVVLNLVEFFGGGENTNGGGMDCGYGGTKGRVLP